MVQAGRNGLGEPSQDKGKPVRFLQCSLQGAMLAPPCPGPAGDIGVLEGLAEVGSNREPQCLSELGAEEPKGHGMRGRPPSVG